MNWTLFKKECKSTWKIFLIVLAVLTMYSTIIISMFDPSLGDILAQFEKAMPGIMAAVGMSGAADSDLIHYISSYLFGFVMIIFPLIFSIVLSNRLIVKYVDQGSMACLLATPNKRSKIVKTQAIFLISAILCLLLIMFMVTLVYCQIAFPNELDIGKLVQLNIGLVGLHMLISGLGFLASCIFNELKYSYLISIGIPVLCYIIQMIANQGDTFQNFKYLTFYTLFSPDKIIAGDSLGYYMIVLMYIIASIFYIVGSRIFTKKNLPI